MRHLRLDRGDDRDAARHGRPGRRGHRVHAVLRELRPGRRAVRRDAAVRPAARAGLEHRRGASCGRRSPTAPGPIIVNTPHNPTGKVFTARRARARQRAVPAYDVLCLTDEIYEHIHYLGRGRARPAGDGARPRGPHGDDQRAVQDLRRDRLAGRLDDRPAGDHGQHPQGARLPHRRRGGPAAGGRAPPPWRCPPSYYAGDGAGLPRAAGPAVQRAGRGGVPLPGARRRVLRPVRDRRARPGARLQRVRPPDRAVDPGIAAVPGTSFFADPAEGAGLLRFAFPKRLETLHAAAEKLRAL